MSSRLEAWIEHYRLMGEGKIHPNANGFFVVDPKKETPHVEKKMEPPQEVIPQLKLYTRTQQAVEIARSDVRAKSLKRKRTRPMTPRDW